MGVTQVTQDSAPAAGRSAATLTIAGGVIVALGSFLPWLPDAQRAGTTASILALLCGGSILGIGLVAFSGSVPPEVGIASGLLAVAASVVVAFNYIGSSAGARDVATPPHFGIGIWLVLIGCLLTWVGSVTLFRGSDL
jgi:hypothetical protein